MIFMPDTWEGHESLLENFYCTPLIYTGNSFHTKRAQGLVLRATGTEKGSINEWAFSV
jgi:hypothetical protein